MSQKECHRHQLLKKTTNCEILKDMSIYLLEHWQDFP